MAPAVKVVKLGTERLIALSGVNNSEYGIGYGGIDPGGPVNPHVKTNNSLLDNLFW